LLLLDIDGTLVPYAPVEDGTDIPYGYMRLPIRWPVVRAVADLAAAGVDVVWLTSWPAELALDLGERLGLPPFAVPAHPEPFPGRRRAAWWGGWKTRTALTVVEERHPHRWAWADDDIPSSVRRRLRTCHPEGLVLSPDGQTGLTLRQMARLKRWFHHDKERHEPPQSHITT